MKAHRGVLLMLVVAVLSLMSCAALGIKVGAPRRAGQLAEPTIAPSQARYQTVEERLELSKKAMAQRTALLGKLPPPMLLCKRTHRGAVTVDGRLAAPEWQGAMVVSGFRLTRKLKSAGLQTWVMMQWDSEYLYIAFDSDDTDLISTITEPDGEFWREDCVEVFIDANGDEMSYIELEVNLRGLLYDAAIADYRPEIDWSADLQHLDVGKGIKICRTRDTHVAVKLNGTLNNSGDTDRGWSCEIAISWDDLARGTNVGRLPPKDGDVWRIGLYRINVNKAQKAGPTEYAAWNPTTSWFHVPWLFGRVVFVE